MTPVKYLKDTPQDVPLLAALFLMSNAFYRLFIVPDYLLVFAWLIAGVLFVLRARELEPITHRIGRVLFWLTGLGILVASWLPVIR